MSQAIQKGENKIHVFLTLSENQRRLLEGLQCLIRRTAQVYVRNRGYDSIYNHFYLRLSVRLDCQVYLC